MPTSITSAVTFTIRPSVAKAIDASSPCSVALQAFDSDKRAGEFLAGVLSPRGQASVGPRAASGNEMPPNAAWVLSQPVANLGDVT
jgi:hypothetical protein